MDAGRADGAQVTLAIADAERARIARQAAAAYPEECCGVLIGSAGVVRDVLPAVNSSTADRQRRFVIDAATYLAADAQARRIGADVLGFYHSHPDHPAAPSAFDLEHAWPNLSYVIVSVRHGVPGDVRSWRLRPDRAGFDEEQLTRGESLSCP